MADRARTCRLRYNLQKWWCCCCIVTDTGSVGWGFHDTLGEIYSEGFEA
jgi:hypothetical protein